MRNSLGLYTVNGTFGGWQIFKLVAAGYLLGAGVIVLPLVGLFNLYNALKIGAEGRGSASPVIPLVDFGLKSLVVAPIVIAIQSVLIGALVVVGLWVLNRGKRIPVTDTRS